MIKQNPKDPIWLVVLQVRCSNEPSRIVGADGRSAMLSATYEEPSEITVHAPDESTAKAYVEQQNPGAKVASAEMVK